MVRSESKGRDPRTCASIGAAMEVHQQLGSGSLEAVFHEAIALESTAREALSAGRLSCRFSTKRRKKRVPNGPILLVLIPQSSK